MRCGLRRRSRTISVLRERREIALQELEQLKGEYRDVPASVLYLERVEAAGMQVLTESILDKDWDNADEAIRIMERLSIV